jgi:hypothetical protein
VLTDDVDQIQVQLEVAKNLSSAAFSVKLDIGCLVLGFSSKFIAHVPRESKSERGEGF